MYVLSVSIPIPLSRSLSGVGDVGRCRRYRWRQQSSSSSSVFAFLTRTYRLLQHRPTVLLLATIDVLSRPLLLFVLISCCRSSSSTATTTTLAPARYGIVLSLARSLACSAPPPPFLLACSLILSPALLRCSPISLSLSHSQRKELRTDPPRSPSCIYFHCMDGGQDMCVRGNWEIEGNGKGPWNIYRIFWRWETRKSIFIFIFFPFESWIDFSFFLNANFFLLSDREDAYQIGKVVLIGFLSDLASFIVAGTRKLKRP